MGLVANYCTRQIYRVAVVYGRHILGWFLSHTALVEKLISFTVFGMSSHNNWTYQIELKVIINSNQSKLGQLYFFKNLELRYLKTAFICLSLEAFGFATSVLKQPIVIGVAGINYSAKGDTLGIGDLPEHPSNLAESLPCLRIRFSSTHSRKVPLLQLTWMKEPEQRLEQTLYILWDWLKDVSSCSRWKAEVSWNSLEQLLPQDFSGCWLHRLDRPVVLNIDCTSELLWDLKREMSQRLWFN